MSYGTILPGIGIPGVTFGMTKEEVLAIMGDPETQDRDEFPDGSSIDSFNFESLGLYFHFGSAFDYVFNSVRIWRADLQLFDCPIAGLSTKEALVLFQSNGVLPDPNPFPVRANSSNRIASYNFDGLDLTAYFYDNLLSEVHFGTLWADEETPIFP